MATESMSSSKKYLVTSALPYANGPLHFGHLAGVYLPADVYTRHLKMMGKTAIHISGSDEHGVAIMLNANKAGVAYQEYVDSWHKEHKELFDQFKVEFDFFGQTSSDYHEKEVIEWFHALNDKGLIETKETQQLQCQDCHSHLPDRFVSGTCYECGYENARGDECPNCGILIDPIRLLKPQCQICTSHNISPVNVTQYYLMLSKFESEFNSWLEGREVVWRNTVFPFVKALCKDGLQDRAISRDLDWGIDVPLAEARGKKLYVWFDAPIGYVSNTKKMLEQSGETDPDAYLKDWWQNKDAEIVHFIGKDNIIFHCIIFPCMSMASQRALPAYDVPANQYLNLEGKQFSKSSGWYVDAKEAIDTVGADALRYYLLSILPETSDSSFTWSGLQARLNGELANNIGNLVSRCLKFWAKKWPEGLKAEHFQGFFDSDIYKRLQELNRQQHHLIEEKHIRRALESYMLAGHEVNGHFTELAPWASFKTDPDSAAKTIGETSLMILVLGAMARPFLPDLSEKICKCFGLSFDDNTSTTLESIYRGDFDKIKDLVKEGLSLAESPQILVPKIEDHLVEEMNEKLKAKTSES